MDLKKLAAVKAATLVTGKGKIGLGAGSTIAYLVEALKQSLEEGLELQFVTSSYSTRQLLENNGLPVGSTTSCQRLDIYFDGCDQLDKQLNALKSGGGIHTQEKLLASMAEQFILIGDRAKLVETFSTSFPLVLEILPGAAAFIPYKIPQLFPDVETALRMSSKMDGPVITENGNYLLDVYFKEWPELPGINPILKDIAGIVETSLFYRMANKAILAGTEGVVVFDRN